MLVVLVLTVLYLSPCNCIKGYYWREFLNGEIPPDALSAGHDVSGQDVYIGQAYMRGGGLVVGQLSPGIQQIWVSIGGPKTTNRYIKILCGSPENFYWMKANRTTLHLDLAGKHAVIGGQEDTYGIMNIGRIFSGGETIVGKVNTFWLEDATFYYIQNRQERLLGSYEILIYKEGAHTDEIELTAQEIFSKF